MTILSCLLPIILSIFFFFYHCQDVQSSENHCSGIAATNQRRFIAIFVYVHDCPPRTGYVRVTSHTVTCHAYKSLREEKCEMSRCSLKLFICRCNYNYLSEAYFETVSTNRGSFAWLVYICSSLQLIS